LFLIKADMFFQKSSRLQDIFKGEEQAENKKKPM
jgi:hypothetical protein